MPEFSPQLLAYGFVWYVAFLFSTTCHEAAHALVAKLGGDDTAARGGQVSLNPLPHIQREPWGMVLIPILSFIFTRGMIGWASAPFNPEWERRHPRRAALMALAGPAANYTLMLLAVVGLRTGHSMGWLHTNSETGQPGLATVALEREDHHAAARYCDRIVELLPDCLEGWHNLRVSLERILTAFSAPKPVAVGAELVSEVK